MVQIKAVDIYHPEQSKDNAFYVDHFQKQGKDIGRFLKQMGRKSRYVIDNEHENGLTMGIEASKRVLQKAGVTGKDIDMIVFSTQVPETTFPANALFLHDAIGAPSHAMVMDSNANCAGMTLAVEQAVRTMQANPAIGRALIVGSDYNSLIANPAEEITYTNYGDAAAAVLLEATEGETGFIDAQYFTDSVNRDKIMYPEKGLSHAVRGQSDSAYIQWLPFDGHIAMPPTYELIETLLTRNNLTSRDIKAFCLSQFSLGNIVKIQGHFQLQDDQIVYVGDRFGYTGTSSPFIALHEGIESGRIQRGDHVLFWTIGAGYQLAAMLFTY